MTKTIFAVDPGNVSGWAVMTVEAEPRMLVNGKADFIKPMAKHFQPSYAHLQIITARNFQDGFKYPECSDNYHIAIEGQYLDEGNRRNVDSLIKLARKAGRWEEAACAHGLTYEYIQPSVWITAELGKGLRSDQVAKMAKEKCQALYRVKDLSEHEYCAILIGRYVAIREYRKGLQLTINTERVKSKEHGNSD